MAACDVYRPAAVDQLIKVGAQAGATVYEQGTDRNPVDIAKWALGRAKEDGKDVLIVDTSGRLHVDAELMAELVAIRAAVKPHNILLVVDAMTGQDAVNVAEQFAAAVQFDGVVMTKLDGDARGGAALSVRAVTGKPILFASTGEKLDQFERFHPERMAQRILGMGDVMTLIEKAEREFDEDQSEELEKRLRAGDFNLDDFLSQLKMMRRMGPLQGLLGMIPGVGAQMRGVKVDEREVDRLEAIILSMTRGGAAAAGADQGVAAAADRAGVGDQRAGRQSAGQAVRAGAQDDAQAGQGQDAGSRGVDAWRALGRPIFRAACWRVRRRGRRRVGGRGSGGRTGPTGGCQLKGARRVSLRELRGENSRSRRASYVAAEPAGPSRRPRRRARYSGCSGKAPKGTRGSKT